MGVVVSGCDVYGKAYYWRGVKGSTRRYARVVGKKKKKKKRRTSIVTNRSKG